MYLFADFKKMMLHRDYLQRELEIAEAAKEHLRQQKTISSSPESDALYMTQIQFLDAEISNIIRRRRVWDYALDVLSEANHEMQNRISELKRYSSV